MRPYKRISRKELASIVAAALFTGGTISFGSPIFAQEMTTSSFTETPQIQDRYNQKISKKRSSNQPNKQDTITDSKY